MNAQSHQYQRLSIDSKPKASKLVTHPGSLCRVSSKSPRTLSKGRQFASPSKIMIKKITSGQLFREAHCTNGETYLKDPPQSALLGAKRSSLQSHPFSRRQGLRVPMTPTTLNSESKLQINQVMSINIQGDQKEGDLTRLINRGVQQNDSFDNISQVMTPQESGCLLNSVELKKGDTIQELLHCLGK